MEQPIVIAALAALAQPSRLQIFRRLVVAGEAGLTPGVLSAELGVPAATLSFHLKALLHAGLVAQSRHGRHLIYRADYARVRSLIDYLTDNCCDGKPCLVEAQPATGCRQAA